MGKATARKYRIVVRVTRDWMDWVKVFAAHLDLTTADLVQHALRTYADSLGYDRLPPARTRTRPERSPVPLVLTPHLETALVEPLEPQTGSEQPGI